MSREQLEKLKADTEFVAWDELPFPVRRIQDWCQDLCSALLDSGLLDQAGKEVAASNNPPPEAVAKEQVRETIEGYAGTVKWLSVSSNRRCVVVPDDWPIGSIVTVTRRLPAKEVEGNG